MIPLSSKESVEYKDSDSVVWKFKPKTGSLEKEMFGIYDDNIDYKERLKVVDAFIDKILISPKADYNSDEQAEIIRFWNMANKLTPEEKKS
jgi:hypothetical protein